MTNEIPIEKRAADMPIMTDEERAQMSSDANALKWAQEEAGHPIDRLFGMLKERIASERVRLDSLIAAERAKLDALEAKLDAEHAADRTRRQETLDFVKNAMIEVTVSRRATSAIGEDVSQTTGTLENVVARAPTAANLAREMIALPQMPLEPVREAVETPEGYPAVGLSPPGSGAVEAARRTRRGLLDIKVLSILAAAVLAGGLALALLPAQAASSCRTLSQCRALDDGYCRYRYYDGDRCWTPNRERSSHVKRHRILSAKPAVKRAPIAAIDQNPHGDPSWYAPVPIERVDYAFEALGGPIQ